MKHLIKIFSLLALSLFFVFGSCVYAANGDVNWDEGKIVATGIGVAPPKAVNIAQAKAMARRAAVVDAYRQMAEIISGVNVNSESTVGNFMTDSDIIRTKVNATIKGARVVSERMTSDGGYEVTMIVPMFGVTGSLASAVIEPPAVKETFPEPVAEVEPTPVAVPSAASTTEAVETGSTSVSATVTVNIPTVPSTPSAPSTPTPSGSSAAPAPAGKAVGIYTGLVVDCRGLDLQSVMSPVIKNENGSPIYGYKNLDIDKVVSNGMASYSRDINNHQRAGANPLIVKAVRLDGNNANPVLSVADANRVLIENGATKFLDNTNVVFVR